ncbi:MAG: ATP-binding protein [Firmicutes bacterium]|nr:ATP-binding protein [Bacillota bacterium]
MNKNDEPVKEKEAVNKDVSKINISGMDMLIKEELFYVKSFVFELLAQYEKRLRKEPFEKDSLKKKAAYLFKFELEAYKEGFVLPLKHLRESFMLSSCQELCLLLALAADIDETLDIGRFIGAQAKRPTPGLAAELFEFLYDEFPGDIYEFFSGDPPLAKLLYEDTFYPAGGSLMGSPLILKKRIYSFITSGDIFPPEELSGCMELYISDPFEKTGIFDERILNRGELLWRALEEEKTDSICIYGRRGTGKKRFIKKLAAEHNTALLFADGEELYKKDAERSIFKAVLTECFLTGATLCIVSGEEERNWDILAKRFMANGIGKIIFINTFDKPVDISYPMLSMRMELPDAELSGLLWEHFAKKHGISGDFTYPAANIRLSAAQIEGAVKELALFGKELSPQDIMSAGAKRLKHDLDKKATNVRLIFDWNDLIAEERIISKLKDACKHIQYKYKVYNEWGFKEKMPYGRGLCMMFYGPSGTGKTMAAQVIAKELGLSLYRIDLSRVISKYIGETEQNLNEIFYEAERSNAILFFDEADALFSKRTDIKDSNDKYSNAETAYLLQKTEEYSGVSILASNLMYNLDDAFLRRIHHTIYFSMPDKKLRKRVWKEAFSGAPFDSDVDFNFLAEKFELSPASIKQVILNASFLSAAESDSISMKNIFKALRNEYSKNDKIMLKEELENYSELW